MFDALTNIIEPNRIIRYELTASGSSLTFASVLELWKSDGSFRSFNTELLSDAPFPAFRWETPALTSTTAAEPFEFVLIDSPDLCSRPTDKKAFASFFTDDNSDNGIVTFDNLGGDGTMIVPSPRGPEAAYGHFAAFLRSAPASQVDAIWRVIANSVASKVTDTPVWLNTAGGGVAWLHVRLDTRPKYYRFGPYRQVP